MVEEQSTVRGWRINTGSWERCELQKERKGNLTGNRRVKRESQRMEMARLRGYYRMKAINECEAAGSWRVVCLHVSIIRVCMSVDGAHLSRTSVTCRVSNKVSMLGVSFAPTSQHISPHELSNTWLIKVNCALREAVRPLCMLHGFKVCVCSNLSLYCVVTPCAAQIFDRSKERERE